MIPRGTAASLVAVLYVVLWASAYVPSKVAASSVPPLWFLVARFATAGVVLAGITLASGRHFPNRPRAWGQYALLGVLANAGYLGLTYTALGRGLSSGIGSVVASTNPLIVALLAPWLLNEALGWRKAAGLAIGFAGVAGVMLARTGTATAAPLEVGITLGGVLSNVASTILFKRIQGKDDLAAITTIQLGAAGLVLVPVALLTEGAPSGHIDLSVVLAFTYLVLVLSVGASFLWFTLLTRGDASRVSAFYFLTPVFGLGFGALLLHESVGAGDLLGLAAVALGIVLVQRA